MPPNLACPVEQLDRTTVRTNSCTPNTGSPSRPKDEQMFDSCVERSYDHDMADKRLSPRQREILQFIESQARDRGYPPSVREIGEAVGLTSPSTVHSHLNTLSRLGYLRRDPSKPRAIEVRWDPELGCRHRTPTRAPRAARRRRRRRHRRAGAGERRGAVPGAARLHRRRRAVHAPRPRRLDDRSRHPRRRLRDRRAAGDRQEGRRRGRRHPRRRGDRQDLPTAATGGSRCSRPTRRCSRWSSPPATSRSTAASSP